MTQQQENDRPVTEGRCAERHRYSEEMLARRDLATDAALKTLEDKIDIVITQQRATNGNVTRLRLWRERAVGAFIGVNLMMPFVLALFSWWLWTGGK